MAQVTSAGSSQEDMRENLEEILASKSYIEKPESLPWYKKNLDELKPRTRDLFENYSHVPAADVESHVRKTRDEAFKVFPYPCVGNWGFLNLSVVDGPVYKEVVERVKKGDLYLDIGCCMGQDIRALVQDGAIEENLYGSDLKKDFWEIGYDLFLDRSSLKAKFIEADVFDAESGLKELNGKLDIVHAASFFHLFDWDGQVKAAKRVVGLLKAEPGVLVFGRQGGNVNADVITRLMKDQQAAYWHNPESWAKMWKQVGDETGTKWEVDAFLGEEDLAKRTNAMALPAGSRFMTFSIRRV